ncbi:MAG: tripartite tricarboxylate transporter substrate-binding protein [Armatimonadota bacterium]|nr:tripartite tricarboxylate transporter substrate-binding protein [Armatimonadota bacterium]MDR7427041.1 tripartite tricarboxylate transporter substrate-binding protein [Armatimonadota bacterium]MDR7464510.1 tripartite tricarboxylate transporter substrate-binding protein [Armatimonadota bacterium]MDR7474809.1 tripartite tricarboxylate transporter substrate-binding protein [Armatimonadota bacterium]
MREVQRAALAVVVGLLLVAGVTPVQGQVPYYAGKTIEIIVPFGAGGGTDIETRFLAPFFEKHIAGNPKIVVTNRPGGGSILGANFYAANAKPDGFQIFASSGSTVIPFLLGVPQVQYDYRKWRLVKVNGVGGVAYVSPATGIRRPEDVLNPARPLVYGGISATGLDLSMLLAFELLGINVRSVLGFEGRGPARLAFERGETNIDYQTTPAYLSQVVPLIREGKARPLFSFGFTNEKGQLVRDPAAPDLPTIYEFYQQVHKRKPDGLLRWKALQALLVPAFSFQKTLWVPQGTPPEALNALWEAVDKMNADPEFREKSKNILEGYTLFRGDKMEGALLRSLTVTLDVRKFILDLLRTKYNVAI